MSVAAAFAEPGWPQGWRQTRAAANFLDFAGAAPPAAAPVVGPPITVSRPQWFDQTLRRILELIALGPNWDGRRSAAVSKDALNFALQVLWRSMAPTTAAPSIVPLGNGGLQLLWSSGTADVEVEVIRPNEIIIYHLDRCTGAEREWQAETEFSELAGLLTANFT
jgi:hypothetical protein